MINEYVLPLCLTFFGIGMLFSERNKRQEIKSFKVKYRICGKCGKQISHDEYLVIDGKTKDTGCLNCVKIKKKG